MIVITFAEMLVWPAVPTIAADLAPKNKLGFTKGLSVVRELVEE